MDSVVRPRLALSIRQPHVEAILRGIKQFEYRRMSTTLRERIYLYASRSRYSQKEEQFWLAEYGFDRDPQFRLEELEFGVIVATVAIIHCVPGGRYGATWSWQLAEVERITPPQRPTGRPQPVFFDPFPRSYTKPT